MADKLSPIKEILENFIHQIHEREEIFKSVGGTVEEQKNNDNIDRWTIEECHIWINVEPYSYLLEKSSKPLSIPSIFHKKGIAWVCYERWIEKCLDIQDYEQYIIPMPSQEQTLLEYLHYLDKLLSIKPKLKERWKLSLRSFCDFLRKEHLENEIGFLDVIFPQKMDFFYKRVIRKIPLEVYPIDIVDIQAILKQLACEVTGGRANSQQTTAEALALCWICLVCANYQTMTELKLLTDQNITFASLIKQETPKEKILFGKASYYSDLESYYVVLSTLFYEEKFKISKTLYDYLYALCEVNNGRVFTHSLRSLRRILGSTMNKLKLSSNPQEISFLTFLSKPHEHIGYRYKPKNKK